MQKTRYRLKERCAGHEQNGRWYFSGDVIETVVDLIKFHPAKFELESEWLARNAHQKAIKVEAEKVDVKEAVESVVINAEIANEDKDESKFTFADEAGLQVVDLGRGWFNVVDPDEGDKVLNVKKLRESELEQFVNNYVNGIE